MSLLKDIEYVPIRENTKGFRKPAIQIICNESELCNITEKLNLTEWQVKLVRLIDIRKQSMNYIANCIGCDRQYIHQEYKRIYDKVMKLKLKSA